MGKTLALAKETILQNQNKLQTYLAQKNLDAMYVSSFDPFLNEYVPLEDNHRYYLSGFTGSMAELLVPREGKIRLYVDGRYFEQADQEVNLDYVEVRKCPSDVSTIDQLIQDIHELKLKKIGFEPSRTPLNYHKKFSRNLNLYSFKPNELSTLIDFSPLEYKTDLQFISRKKRGRDTLEKLSQIFRSNEEGMYLSSLDSISWITNCRGYQLPYLSSFYARAILTREKAYILVDPLLNIPDSALKEPGLEFIKIDYPQMEEKLSELQGKLHLKQIYFDPQMINCWDFQSLMRVFGVELLTEKLGGIYSFQSIKEPIEIDEFKESFKRSNKAIFQTIKWVKNSIAQGKMISELDLSVQTNQFYQTEGAKSLSFNTIAGVGANASIIHYGSPSSEIMIKETDMVLLDSGGYFEGGFATDTTRTFLASWNKDALPKMREIYTLVLKGLLHCQSAVFPPGTRGAQLDALARAPMRKFGYDYNHGTGHGVGIHVHEPGVRLSTISDVPMKKGQVVSIEPGIYLPGFGGVRLENIVYVETHPEFSNLLHFVPLTYIGFDPALIEESLLNDEEFKILQTYEEKCVQCGTSFLKKS